MEPQTADSLTGGYVDGGPEVVATVWGHFRCGFRMLQGDLGAGGWDLLGSGSFENVARVPGGMARHDSYYC